MPGIVIDERFEIDKHITKAAGSQHFLARDLESGGSAFLKVIRPDTADSNETLQRQLQEYQLLRKLDHPNAVKVIKAGLTPDNAFYIAMEYVEGRRLSQIVDEYGLISAEHAAYYLEQLAGVLDLAHGYGIVHRDLSMPNILVCEHEDGSEQCKLVGFASAKVLADNSANVTQAGLTIGNPDYMSPEQAMGRKVTKLSDIYSMGVVLFAAMTGRLPFKGKNDMQTLIAHVKQPIPTFTEVNPQVNVPHMVEMVVRQAMAKEAAYRPKSAGQLAKMFSQAVAHPDQMPEGLEELQQNSQRSASVEVPVPTNDAAPPDRTGLYGILVLAAVAIGALVGYALSQ